MNKLLLFSISLFVFLSCSKDDDTNTDQSNSQISPPEWLIGDWYQYETNEDFNLAFGNEEGQTGNFIERPIYKITSDDIRIVTLPGLETSFIPKLPNGFTFEDSMITIEENSTSDEYFIKINTSGVISNSLKFERINNNSIKDLSSITERIIFKR